MVSSVIIRKDGGTHRLNTLTTEAIEIKFPSTPAAIRQWHETIIPVGHYLQFEAFPTCGLATEETVIGEYDDPRYFLDSQRMNA